jgi:hypothetical protein
MTNVTSQVYTKNDLSVGLIGSDEHIKRVIECLNNNLDLKK